MKKVDPEVLYVLGVEKTSVEELTLTERKNIFQDAMTNFCDGFCLEDIINWIPLKIRNEELEKGLKGVREKHPRCLGWHFEITKLLTEPQRSKEMLRIYKESVPYGDQAGYSALYYRLKFINEASEPDRSNELANLLASLIRSYCVSIDYFDYNTVDDGIIIFPQHDCEKIIDMIIRGKRLIKIKKISDNFFDNDLLNEAKISAKFLPLLYKEKRMLEIEAREPFVKRFIPSKARWGMNCR